MLPGLPARGLQLGPDMVRNLLWTLAAVALEVSLLAPATPPAALAMGTQVQLLPYGVEEDASAGTVGVRLGVWDEVGKVPPALEAQDFEVTDGGKSATIKTVSLGAQDPLSLVIVVDNSRHWVEAGDPAVDARRVLVQSTSAFLDTFQRNSGLNPPRVTLVTMNRPADLSTNSADQLSPDLAAVRGRIDQMRMVDGDAPLRDRLADAIHLLRNEPAGRRRVVLLLSDGNDVASPITYDQILASAERADVQVFAAGVAAQQAAQLEVLTQERHGVFRNARHASDLAETMVALDGAIQSSYRVTYVPQLREGAHSGQIALRGQPWVKFEYNSSARAPEPQLRLTSTERKLGWLWTAVSVSIDPGTQRDIKGVVYKVDGRPVASGAPGQPTKLYLPFGFPSLSGDWMLSAQVDDGLAGESNTVEYADSLGGEALGGGLAIAGAIALFWLARRILRSPRRDDRGLETAFSFRAGSQKTDSALKSPIHLRKSGFLGRGAVAYGIDGSDPFFGGVSRQHVEINVRDEGVLGRACRSATVGRCHVEVQAPGSATTSVLDDQTFTRIEVGSLVILGAQPAPDCSERPTFELDGPRHTSKNDGAQTRLTGVHTSTEDEDPARTQYVPETNGQSPSSAAAAFARWLPR